jgi:hypothetical protein
MVKFAMVPCTVSSHHSSYIVEFEGGKSKLLQSDYEQVYFAVASGFLNAPRGWDGSPSKLGKSWEDFNMEDISECPEEYLENAEFESNE